MRRFIYWLIAAILTVLIVSGIRTISLSSKQISLPIENGGPTVPASAMRHLQEAVRIPTVSNESSIDTAVFSQFLHYLSEEYPLSFKFLDPVTINGFNPVFYYAGRDTTLKPALLLAHYDVVPVDSQEIQLWTHAPFSGHGDEHHIWGRGTIDDKIGVIALLEAVELRLKQGFAPRRSIYIAFGSDEEVLGQRGGARMASYFEDRGLQFEFILDEGMLVVEDGFPGINRPIAMIGTAEKGYASFRLSVDTQESGHASMPNSESAIGILSRAISGIEDRPAPADISGSTKLLFDYLAPEMSGLQRWIFSNLWLFQPFVIKSLEKDAGSNAMIRSTVAPTMLQAGVKDNVMASRAQAVLNCRILPGESSQLVIDRLTQTIGDDRIDISPLGKLYEPGKIADPSSLGYSSVERCIRRVFPDAIIAPALYIATSDSRHYQHLSEQVLRFSPLLLTRADLRRIHGIDERIHRSNIEKAVHFYYYLIDEIGVRSP